MASRREGIKVNDAQPKTTESIMKNVERRWDAHDKNPAKGFLFGSSNGCLSS